MLKALSSVCSLVKSSKLVLVFGRTECCNVIHCRFALADNMTIYWMQNVVMSVTDVQCAQHGRPSAFTIDTGHMQHHANALTESFDVVSSCSPSNVLYMARNLISP